MVKNIKVAKKQNFDKALNRILHFFLDEIELQKYYLAPPQM